MNTEDSIAMETAHGEFPAALSPSPAMPNKSRKRRRHPRWLLNLGLVSLSALFGVVALEGAMRLTPALEVQTGEGEFVFCTSDQVRHQTHPRYGYTEVPGNSYFERYSSVDPWAYVKINAEGFRSNARNGGEPVLVLGDSLTRGTLVNEPEAFTGLLERWRNDLSFHNYGAGGYGQSNQIRLYDDKGKAAPHQLVVAQYSLSTDIDDNVERAKLRGDGVDITITPAVGTPKRETKPLARVHLFLWKNTRLYPWVFNAALRPFVSNWDARRDISGALEITRRLMLQLEEKVQANGADMLVLVLPSWAEMAGRDDGMAPDRQRAMLRRFAANNPGVFLLDMTPILKAEDPNRTYGKVDKHLTPYGHYLVASAMDRWLTRDWPRGRLAEPKPHVFTPPQVVTPRCDLAPQYERAIGLSRPSTSSGIPS